MNNPHFTVEDARFQLLLIHLGIFDRFYPWLNALMDAEDPLSDAVLELSWCPADMNHIVHILEEHTRDAQIDDFHLVKMLRNDLLQRMEADGLDMAGCMKILAKTSGLPYSNAEEPWISIDNLKSLYDLTLEPDGGLPLPLFEQYFSSFMQEGTPISYGTDYQTTGKKLQGFFRSLFCLKSKT